MEHLKFINHDERYKKLSNILDKNYDAMIKKIYKKNRSCMWPNCNDLIQEHCHLLQRNRILNNISDDDNKLLEISITHPSQWNDMNSPLKFKKVGIGHAFSAKLFCNTHDNKIFTPIEKVDLNLSDYNSQLLLTYRAICNEIFQKKQSIEIFQHQLDSLDKHDEIAPLIKELIKQSDEISQMIKNIKYDWGKNIQCDRNSIDKLMILKNSIECEINSKSSTKEFDFICRKEPSSKFPVAASCVITSEMYHRACLHNLLPNNTNKLNPTEYNNPYFLHIIPYNQESYFIIGKHRNYCDTWINGYINNWSQIPILEFGVEVTNLLLTRCTSWCMSPNFYSELSNNKKELVDTAHWRVNIVSYNQEYNIFN